ncbi:MAG: PAS domain S-box protein [Gallionella sp.]
MTIHILIVDDSEDDQRLYRRALKKSGDYKITTAFNAETGLVCARQERPDLILLDYSLPDMDGLAFMKAQRVRFDFVVPVIMLTGEGSETVAVEAMKMGVNDYVVKDTAGGFLRLLPSVIARVLAADAEKIENQKLKILHQTILHTVADGIIGIDKKGVVLFANQAAEKVLHAPHKGLIHREIRDIIWPEGVYLKWCDHPLANLPEDTASICRESDIFHCEEGRLFWARYTAARLKYQGVDGLVIAFQDISERRMMEEKLSESEDKYHSIFESIRDGVELVSMAGRIIDLNHVSYEQLGYSKIEMQGQILASFASAEYAANVPDRMALIKSKGQLTFESERICKDGSILPIEVNAHLVHICNETLYLSVIRDISDRKRLEQELRNSESRLRDAILSSPNPIMMHADDGEILMLSQAWIAITGYEYQDIRTMQQWVEKAYGGMNEMIKARIDALFELKQVSDSGEIAVKTASGEMRQWHFLNQPLQSLPDGRRVLLSLATDITERKRAEQELRIAATAFETHEAIMIADVNSNIIRVNQAFSDITGYQAEEVIGKNPRFLKSEKHDRDFYLKMWQALLSSGTWAGEIWDRRKNGEIYPKWMTLSAVKNNQWETTNYVAIFSDITERKRREEEIKNLAFYDVLTTLPNRRLFIDRFRTALMASLRNDDYGAVLFIDMDHFKALNDSLGHDYGDLMLIEVGVRIKSCVREMDTVARFGGDEFVVLINGINTDKNDVAVKTERVSEAIREALEKPYYLNGHEHRSSSSIGISLYHGNDESLEDLIKHADMAMYQAKISGHNAVRFFEPVMQGNLTRHDTH